jgi:hypothetical protein
MESARFFFMLKCLAILGAVILGFTIYVACQNQRTASQTPNKGTNPPVASVSPSVHNEHPQGNTENAEGNLPSWYGLFAWPNGTTAWAIILTLVAISWQSNETKKAAQAALLNAQAVINAERPWILISVKSPPGPMGGFTVHARNKGRAPAMITESRMGCAAVKNVSELPLKAVFPIENHIRDRIIIPSGAVHVTWFDQQLFKAVLKDNLPQFSWDGQIFGFGKVLYRDLANPDKFVIHETRWIGLYQPPVGDEGGNSIFRVEGLGVSDEYDRYT